MIIIQTEIRKLKFEDSKTLNCLNCNKSIVCTLHRGLNTLINSNWQGEARPFLPENIAMICKHFQANIKENL